MNINLTPELERLIQDKISAGLYRSQSEVVREALRLLVEQDRLRHARIARIRAAHTEHLAHADRKDVPDNRTAPRAAARPLRKRRAPGTGKPSPKTAGRPPA
jgi:antitoxin ParD1/3/4